MNCAETIIRTIIFPVWIWRTAAVILLTRLVSYIVGYCKYHIFSSLHTDMNKVTGLLLFVFPLLFVTSGIIISLFAFISAIQELLITIIT